MRSLLLLALAPIACTMSSAAPHRDRGQPLTARASSLIEHGSGCGTQSYLAGRAPGRAMVAKADADDEVAVEGDAPAAEAPRPMPSPPPAPPRVAPAPAPGVATRGGGMGIASGAAAPIAQAPAGVRAGEWDDNANYRDYVRWLGQNGHGVARLDVSSRQFLVVTDAAGKPMPNCSIAIRGKHGRARLTTTASGRAILFPHAVGIGGDHVTATASCDGATASATFGIGTLDGVVHLALGAHRALPARRTVDLAFVLDTTGSMSEEIEAVKSTIRQVAGQLGDDQVSVRIGLVQYKDRVDCIKTQTFPFSSDLNAFARQVDGLTADGGGDYPEDMQAGLAAALDKLDWRADASTRMIVVIGDAPPHLDYADEPDYANAARRAAARGIKIYTVAASGMDQTGQIVMRQLAQYTGATDLFVLRGGAGPQSVGGGDPGSSCGGTHEDYASGNLDHLIVRKIRGELASLDANPMLIPGRGEDENAKPCAQRLVVAE